MKILLAESEHFNAEALSLLKRGGDVTAADLDREQLLASVGDVEVLWVRLRHQVDGEVLDAAPRLKYIVSPTTGLNHIDVVEAERRGIHVICLKGETAFLKDVRATAEHTLALTLSLMRHLPDAADHVSNGGWNRDLFRGSEISGKTVGVVGYGRLGRIVADLFHALGARILATDSEPVSEPLPSHVRLVALDELLAASDIVTLHASYSETSQGFFTAAAFEGMKEGSWFVNTARGELVDEDALLKALQEGRLAGAAIDVLAGESLSVAERHPLVAYARTHSNLIITPHIGGCTFESMAKTEMFLAEKLSAVTSTA